MFAFTRIHRSVLWSLAIATGSFCASSARADLPANLQRTNASDRTVKYIGTPAAPKKAASTSVSALPKTEVYNQKVEAEYQKALQEGRVPLALQNSDLSKAEVLEKIEWQGGGWTETTTAAGQAKAAKAAQVTAAPAKQEAYDSEVEGSYQKALQEGSVSPEAMNKVQNGTSTKAEALKDSGWKGGTWTETTTAEGQAKAAKSAKPAQPSAAAANREFHDSEVEGNYQKALQEGSISPEAMNKVQNGTVTKAEAVRDSGWKGGGWTETTTTEGLLKDVKSAKIEENPGVARRNAMSPQQRKFDDERSTLDQEAVYLPKEQVDAKRASLAQRESEYNLGYAVGGEEAGVERLKAHDAKIAQAPAPAAGARAPASEGSALDKEMMQGYQRGQLAEEKNNLASLEEQKRKSDAQRRDIYERTGMYEETAESKKLDQDIASSKGKIAGIQNELPPEASEVAAAPKAGLSAAGTGAGNGSAAPQLASAKAEATANVSDGKGRTWPGGFTAEEWNSMSDASKDKALIAHSMDVRNGGGGGYGGAGGPGYNGKPGAPTPGAPGSTNPDGTVNPPLKAKEYVSEPFNEAAARAKAEKNLQLGEFKNYDPKTSTDTERNELYRQEIESSVERDRKAYEATGGYTTKSSQYVGTDLKDAEGNSYRVFTKAGEDGAGAAAYQYDAKSKSMYKLDGVTKGDLTQANGAHIADQRYTAEQLDPNARTKGRSGEAGENRSWKDKHGNDKECDVSSYVGKQMPGWKSCSGTRTLVQTSQVVNQVGQMAGSAAVNVQGQVSNAKAQNEGTQVGMLKAAASQAKFAGMKDLGLGAVNTGLSLSQFMRARSHGKQGTQFDKAAKEAEEGLGKDGKAGEYSAGLAPNPDGGYVSASNPLGQKIVTGYEFNNKHRMVSSVISDCDSSSPPAVYQKCIANVKALREKEFDDKKTKISSEVLEKANMGSGEQGEVKDQAKIGALQSGISAASQLLTGFFAMKTAKEYEKAAKELEAAQNNALKPPGADDVPQGSDSARSPFTSPQVAEQAATAENSNEADGIPTQDAGFNPGGPDGGLGGGGPIPDGFKIADSGGGGKGGGAGGGVGGAGTSAQTPEKEPGTQLAIDERGKTYFESGGGGRGGAVRAAGNSDSGGPNLAELFAKLFPQGEEKDHKDIEKMAFRDLAAQRDSGFLGKDVNIFNRITDRYKDRNKIGAVGNI